MSTTTYSAQSFADAGCKRDAVTYAIKATLQLHEDVNLRKHLITTYNKTEGEDGYEPILSPFAQQLVNRERNLRKNGDVYYLGFLLNLDPEKIEKKVAPKKVKVTGGMTKSQKAWFGLFGKFATELKKTVAAYETAMNHKFKRIADVEAATAAVDQVVEDISPIMDELFGITSTVYADGHLTAAYGDVEGLEQWLLAFYKNYTVTLPHGFDWHTKRAWVDALHNARNIRDQQEQQAA